MKTGVLLEKHDKLRQSLDRWFGSVRTRYAALMVCGRGCIQCCHGLFDISLPDAFRLAEGYGTLSEELQVAIANRASAIQHRICQNEVELKAPFFLHTLSQERIDWLIYRMPRIRCPLLDEQDSCLLYDYRPIACRLEGVPMVDTRDGLFGDWCELNFKEGVFPETARDLSLDYYEIQAIELEATGNLSEVLLASRQEEATVFVPSVIAAFGSFWKSRVKD